MLIVYDGFCHLCRTTNGVMTMTRVICVDTRINETRSRWYCLAIRRDILSDAIDRVFLDWQHADRRCI